LLIFKLKQLENMEAYINKYGVKTSKKLDKIVNLAWDYMNNGDKKTWSEKMATKKMQTLRDRFEKEVKNIGGVDYTFGDSLC